MELPVAILRPRHYTKLLDSPDSKFWLLTNAIPSRLLLGGYRSDLFVQLGSNCGKIQRKYKKRTLNPHSENGAPGAPSAPTRPPRQSYTTTLYLLRARLESFHEILSAVVIFSVVGLGLFLMQILFVFIDLVSWCVRSRFGSWRI